MKKILLLMMIAALVFSCKTKQPLTSTRALETVNVGDAPNDGTGDPLRTAFQKINTAIGVMNDVSLDQATGATGTGNLVYSASPTLTGTVTLPTATSIGDVSSTEIGYVNNVTSSIQTQLNSKVNISDTTSMLAPYILDSEVQSDINDTITARLAGGTVGVALADSNKYDGGYATPAWVDANAGGNADSAKIVTQTMQFITGVTAGAPENGDSIIASSYFEDKNLKLYVNGERKYYNTTTTNTVEGFRFVTDTGIIVKPTLATNDQVIVEINDTTYWTTLAFNQDLLDSLVAYYKFDETSGTALADEIGGNTATLDGVANQDGIVGRAVQLIDAGDDISIPFKAGVSLGQSEAFSLSFWLYLDSLQSDVGYEGVLYRQNNNSSPYIPHTILLGASSYADRLTFKVTNTEGAGDYIVRTSGTLSKETWYHIVAVCPGDGGLLELWLDGVDVSSGAWEFSGNLYEADMYGVLGNATTSAGNTVYGRYDEFMHYNKALTESEIKKIYNIQSVGGEIF